MSRNERPSQMIRADSGSLLREDAGLVVDVDNGKVEAARRALVSFVMGISQMTLKNDLGHVVGFIRHYIATFTSLINTLRQRAPEVVTADFERQNFYAGLPYLLQQQLTGAMTANGTSGGGIAVMTSTLHQLVNEAQEHARSASRMEPSHRQRSKRHHSEDVESVQKKPKTTSGDDRARLHQNFQGLGLVADTSPSLSAATSDTDTITAQRHISQQVSSASAHHGRQDSRIKLENRRRESARHAAYLAATKEAHRLHKVNAVRALHTIHHCKHSSTPPLSSSPPTEQQLSEGIARISINNEENQRTVTPPPTTGTSSRIALDVQLQRIRIELAAVSEFARRHNINAGNTTANRRVEEMSNHPFLREGAPSPSPQIHSTEADEMDLPPPYELVAGAGNANHECGNVDVAGSGPRTQEHQANAIAGPGPRTHAGRRFNLTEVPFVSDEDKNEVGDLPAYSIYRHH
ncbi:hypothetical protein P7C70_g3686, partial [Phenoliferia sp. Uapishka_3]